MTGLIDQIDSASREVGSGTIPAGKGHRVALKRRYGAYLDEVWGACTHAEQLDRWFLPITGDLRIGGTYQLEGNAGGRILECEAPKHLRITWVFGEETGPEPASEVELHLSPGDSGGSWLELVQTAVVDPEFWAQFGPGAVGIGWDLALVGLGLHLDGVVIEDKEAWEASEEARAFIARSGQAWGAAFRASGASAAEVDGTTQRAIDAYAPPR